MAGLGMTFMFAGLIMIGGVLIARSLIVDRLGLDAAGHFQAAWAISMQCVGFVLGTMGVDYYPRLSAIIGDRPATSALVNDQAKIGLALGGPVLLIVLGLAPWVVPLLYSDAFGPAVGLLQWMCLGNLVKLASWPMGFIMIAREDRLIFSAIQGLWLAVFLGLLWVLMPAMGVEAAGTAFVAAYSIVAIAEIWAVRRLHGFRWQWSSLQLFAIHLGLAVALLALVTAAPIAGAAICLAASIATGIWGLRLVALMIGPEGKLASLATRVFQAVRWPLPDLQAASKPVHPDAGE